MSKNNNISVGLGLGYIPVTIGGLEFKLSTSDRKRKEFRRTLEKLEVQQLEIENKVKELKNETNLDVEFNLYDETVEIVKKAIDVILGEGSFDQLYEKAGEDVEPVMDAFLEVMEQYKKMQDKGKMKQLVDGKKK